jgi:hypothetical protein
VSDDGEYSLFEARTIAFDMALDEVLDEVVDNPPDEARQHG